MSRRGTLRPTHRRSAAGFGLTPAVASRARLASAASAQYVTLAPPGAVMVPSLTRRSVAGPPGLAAAGGEAAGQRRRRLRGAEARRQREGDDEAAAGEKVTAREAARGHERSAWAARWTARTMRLCEAQRQRWPSSAALICASLGRGLRSSSALADMTMPLPQ